MQDVLYILIGFATAIVGAVPFGLINMSVVEATLNQDHSEAYRIAHGAAMVEVIFGLMAIIGGGMLQTYLAQNFIIQLVIISVLLIAGLVFLFRSQSDATDTQTKHRGFLKGIFLNLVSIQVFLFWIMAVAFLSSRQWIEYGLVTAGLFVLGVWLGKLFTLRIFMVFSQKIIARSAFISKNINRIIGLVLFGAAAIQAFKL